MGRHRKPKSNFAVARAQEKRGRELAAEREREKSRRDEKQLRLAADAAEAHRAGALLDADEATRRDVGELIREFDERGTVWGRSPTVRAAVTEPDQEHPVSGEAAPLPCAPPKARGRPRGTPVKLSTTARGVAHDDVRAALVELSDEMDEAGLDGVERERFAIQVLRGRRAAEMRSRGMGISAIAAALGITTAHLVRQALKLHDERNASPTPKPSSPNWTAGELAGIAAAVRAIRDGSK